MKKDYSNFLIVSDIDGTLNNKLRTTPKVNLEAIRRFTKEEGGHFTLASARCTESLYTHYRKLADKSTPAIVLNGAGIYDFSKQKMVWYNSIPTGSEKIIQKALDKFPTLEVAIFTSEKIYLVKPKLSSHIMMLIDSLDYVELLVMIQDEFGIVIAPSEVTKEEMATPARIIETVKKRLA